MVFQVCLLSDSKRKCCTFQRDSQVISQKLSRMIIFSDYVFREIYLKTDAYSLWCVLSKQSRSIRLWFMMQIPIVSLLAATQFLLCN